MKKAFWKKRRRQKGFTLAELLITILILLMATAIVASGIPVAQRAYYKVVDAGNAQDLLSTAMSVLRDELTTASDVEASGSVITYTSGKDGFRYQISPGTDGNNLYKTGVAHQEPGTPSSSSSAASDTDGIPLISDAATTKNLYLTLESVSELKENNKTTGVTINNLRVMKTGMTDPLAVVNPFVIRALNSEQ